MNNNDINQRQNSEENLLYLFAQRKIYSISKRNIMCFFIINLLFYFLGLNENIQSNSYFKLIYILWGIAFILLYFRERDRVNIAATIQELVDRNLYRFDIDTPFIKQTNLYKIALNIKYKFPKEYEKSTNQNGEDGGVRDWYSNVSEVPLEKGILLCQIENCEWEIKLRKSFQYINMILLFLLIIIYIIVHWNVNLETIIVKLYPVLGILADRLGYIYENKKNIQSNQSINNFLYKIYDDIENYSREDILGKTRDIQNCIYERRKQFAPIPDVFYNLRRREDQNLSNQYIIDLKRKLQD